ncbi:hypothetical protein NAC44_01790 [Allorhizobium sp. BGMRC 0089]|uniref:hypothetical protein n=1 Tax=Allorhizobium sonneratiae TaxID=2934936 RepID=UPI002033ED86|nr:hypothetical protein [Allorhizobium sonneratiae]MCM2291059.1 hypothetical protein [Allorhizobium sonneratiae]
MSVTPGSATPCLDGDETTIPWYNSKCSVTLKNIGDEKELKLEDSPFFSGISTVATSTTGSETTQAALASIKASETFLITLYNLETQNSIQQWQWSYTYAVVNQNGVKLVTQCQTTIAEITANQPYILEGPVATDNPQTTWTPEGWSPYFN